jgi:hypothetical protein
MKLEIKGNPNYVASIVEIKNIIDLEGCNNIKHTTILGNYVIVSKDCKVGDIGIFFPIECSISKEFLSYNNLFDKPELNNDKTKKGFFSEKGRVRCIKLRGFKSEGVFLPLENLKYLNKSSQYIGIYDELKWPFVELKVGDEFDHIDGIKICEKYIVPCHNSEADKRSETKANKKFDRIIPEIFKFHIDTAQLGKNLHQIDSENWISITRKMHGTSAIFSYIPCRQQFNFAEKILKLFKFKIEETEYDYIYSSRKVIKNKYVNKEVTGGYYNHDLWQVSCEELKPFIKKDMTIYFEIVGYVEGERFIQKDYNYGCKPGEHKNYIYRITTTNPQGFVVEWSMLQVQQFCKANGLNAVPLLYYGRAKNLFVEFSFLTETKDDRDKDLWRNKFLESLTEKYLEKICEDCGDGKNIPDEGIVLRKESLSIECWKHKSSLFKLRETKLLDTEEVDIEEEQSIDLDWNQTEKG